MSVVLCPVAMQVPSVRAALAQALTPWQRAQAQAQNAGHAGVKALLQALALEVPVGSGPAAAAGPRAGATAGAGAGAGGKPAAAKGKKGK